MSSQQKQNGFPAGFRAPHLLSGKEKNTPILVAYSGGADSGALLDILLHYGKENGAPIYAVHVHHGIRGEEADRDERFCREQAEKYGIPLFVCQYDVPTLAAQRGKSMETTAREVRYECFSRLMCEHQIPLLCTAHHADDNLETILFNLSRGSGLGGICGIPETRDVEGGMLLRPLLAVDRSELLAYCEQRNIPYVTDGTNVQTEYTRNRIRATVVPELKSLCPGATQAAARLAYLLRQDSMCLESMAGWFVEEMREGYAIDAEKLCGSPYAIVSRALMTLYTECSGGKVLEFCHVDALLRLAQRRIPNSSLSLPGKICAVIENGKLVFKPASHPQETQENPSLAFPLTEGKNILSPISCEIIIEKSNSTINVYKNAIKFSIDSATIVGELFVRCRQGGDKLLQNGMHKSIKKQWSEKKIPATLRQRLPILCDQNGILAVPYMGVRDGASPTSHTNGAQIWTVCICLHE